MLSGFVATRGEPVAAGLTRVFTSAPPLAGMGGEPYALRWQIWLTVPVTDTYTFAVYADDGFSFSGYGLVVSNTTAQVAITKESALSLTLYPGVPYNFSLTYLNYTTTTTGVWRRQLVHGTTCGSHAFAWDDGVGVAVKLCRHESFCAIRVILRIRDSDTTSPRFSLAPADYPKTRRLTTIVRNQPLFAPHRARSIRHDHRLRPGHALPAL